MVDNIDYGPQTLEFLASRGLASEPIHYWVVHEYLQGANANLVGAVDDWLASGKPFDSYFVRDIYERFVLGDAFRQVRGIGDDMEKMLGGLIENLREADRNASGFQDSLNANITRLEKDNDPTGLKAVAHNLLKAAVAANASNEALQRNLEATEQEAQQLRCELEKHRRESITDPLTGLLNRRGMEVEMAHVLNTTPQDPAAMLVLDIDHFKRINDTYGHAVGDVVIRRVADTLSGIVPADAVSARFGGEEFVVLLPGASPDLARSLAERIRESIEKLRLIRRHDKLLISAFTISIGVAARSVTDTLDRLFERADNALYDAKAGGRNRVVMAC